jgi:hypothetical protein
MARPASAQPAAKGAQSPDARERITAVVAGIDHAWREVERRWGCGRLPMLVSDGTRLAMRCGMIRWQDAITAGNVRLVEALAAPLRQGLAAMEAEARLAGHQHLVPDVWEVARDDGTVVAIVRTRAEAGLVVGDGREREVWTLAEVAQCLPRMVGDFLRMWPGARIDRVTQRDEAAAHALVSADPIHGEGEP